MSSTNLAISPVGLQHFTLFDRLPKELRCMTWNFTFLPRIVEILASRYCNNSFYSQAVLPVALHVNQESRKEAQKFYTACFGSYLQPEITLFNYDLDVLYIDIALQEDGLHRLFGVLKEKELASLKYVAVDEEYLDDAVVDHGYAIAGLKRALKAMKGLKEMIVVREIEINSRPRNHPMTPRVKMKFCTDVVGEGLPVEVEELPDVGKAYRGWKPAKSVQMTAVYGWRNL
ncbi:hypothetical protein BKA65DRAFT_492661 [Rhexocercosporidium sp. MPI-PUGE-AT-0058]|nr:hypothetical protein BKA65DRAFT_492661 [Rhexocercosporidium sp. MPI-PUGE-AT-0058]